MAIVTKNMAEFVTAWEDGDIIIISSLFKPVSTGNPRNFLVAVQLTDLGSSQGNDGREVWDVGP